MRKTQVVAIGAGVLAMASALLMWRIVGYTAANLGTGVSFEPSSITNWGVLLSVAPGGPEPARSRQSPAALAPDVLPAGAGPALYRRWPRRDLPGIRSEFRHPHRKRHAMLTGRGEGSRGPGYLPGRDRDRAEPGRANRSLPAPAVQDVGSPLPHETAAGNLFDQCRLRTGSWRWRYGVCPARLDKRRGFQ
jgi:hypothetical protein